MAEILVSSSRHQFKETEVNFHRNRPFARSGHMVRNKQEDLLDLITALLKFNCSLSTTVAAQCSFQSSL